MMIQLIKIDIFSLSTVSSLQQNYFGDPWNVLDFVIVVGSVVDIVAGRLLVSRWLTSFALNLLFLLFVCFIMDSC